MNLIDTHCHIHDTEDFDISPAEIIKNAATAGVNRIITVGTDVKNSQKAVEFAQNHPNVFALVGIYPYTETEQDISQLEKLILLRHSVRSTRHSGLDPESRQKAAWTPDQVRGDARGSVVRNDIVVGLGDIGLDYHYEPHNRQKQIKLFEQQLSLAEKYDLPISFHVREAYDDFWPVFDNFSKLRGTLHSFTDNLENMEKGLSCGLYISINGILTFNKGSELNKVFVQVPLNRVIFETDAPYLTPIPYRGKKNQPAYIAEIAQYLAAKRDINLAELSTITTQNAETLFGL
jgi:TatD DNase family protein